MTGIGRDERAPTARADRAVPRPNTTFKPRRRALSPARQRDVETWLRRWGLAEAGPALCWRDVFADLAVADLAVADPAVADPPVVLDIGFGHGETTIEMARADRATAIIGIEVHTPGVAAVLDAIEHDPLPHVRVVHGDVLRFLTRVPAESLAGIRIYFPDPWPKPRHHQRRLVREDVVPVLVDRLRVGGDLHLATDIAHYAEAMRNACDAEPRLAGGVIDRPPRRPLTRFEQRGLVAGRRPVDLHYTRILDP